MQVNRITNISFRDNDSTKVVGSENAILMLRDPNASVKFQQNKELAQKADVFNTNPLKALGYKLYRTFSMIRDNDSVDVETSKHLNVLA